jgi:hypothetical protein
VTLTPEGVALAAFLLLPGFLADWLAEYFSKAPKRTRSAYESTLSGLAVSVGILLIEAIIASSALLALWLVSRSTFEGLRLDILVNNGAGPYFRAKPVLVAGTLGGALFVAYVLGIVIGYYDLIARLLRPRLSNANLTVSDVWHDALEAAPGTWGMDGSYVLVIMKDSRDVFRGIVRGFGFDRRSDGNRDLVIEHVTYLRGGVGVGLTAPDGPPDLAILNSRDIESIRVIFVRNPTAE